MEPTDFLELWQFAEKSTAEVTFDLARSLLQSRALPCKVVEYVRYACNKGTEQTTTLVSELKERLQPCVKAIVVENNGSVDYQFWHDVAADCLLAIAGLAGSTFKLGDYVRFNLPMRSVAASLCRPSTVTANANLCR